MITDGALRQALKRTLPDAMIPSAFVLLEALPLTPNGKVDRRALPEPMEPAAESRPATAPRTPLEKLFAEVWAEVLRIEHVGVHDNFFSLGGDSILSLQVKALADERGLSFELHELLFHSTVAELAEVARLAPAARGGRAAREGHRGDAAAGRRRGRARMGRSSHGRVPRSGGDRARQHRVPSAGTPAIHCRAVAAGPRAPPTTPWGSS